MKILECKHIREKWLNYLKNNISQEMTLAVIQIGKFSENDIYLKSKIKLAKELNVNILEFNYTKNSNKEEIINKIMELNNDCSITGIMIQKPILEGYNYQELVNYINPEKDVDGVTYNDIISPTVRAIMLLINEYNISLDNKKIVIIGKSDLVGYPLYMIWKNKYDVILCDSQTIDIKEKIKESDVIVIAIGKANYFNDDYFKDNQIIIDVGTNYLNGKLVGDVNLNNINKNIVMTKVPGGVGLLTPICLFMNLLDIKNNHFSNK